MSAGAEYVLASLDAKQQLLHRSQVEATRHINDARRTQNERAHPLDNHYFAVWLFHLKCLSAISFMKYSLLTDSKL